MNEVDLMANPRIKVKSKIIEKNSDDFGRKRWDVEHFEELDQADQNHLSVDKDFRSEKYLVARTEKLQLERKHRKDGFFCQVCNQLYKCDVAYLTHINSVMHNNKLGMSLKVEASSIDDVKSKLDKMSKVKNQKAVLKTKVARKRVEMQRILDRQLKAAIKATTVDDQEDSENSQDKVSMEHSGQSAPHLEHNQVQHTKSEYPVKQETKAQPPLAEPVQKEQAEDVESEEEEEDPDQLLMRSMGLPTSFKSRKH